MSRSTRYDEGTDVSTEQVLKSHEVPWESFTSLRLISDRDAQLIRKYDKRKRDTQAELLEQVGITLWRHKLDGAILKLLLNTTSQSILRQSLLLPIASCRMGLHIAKHSSMY